MSAIKKIIQLTNFRIKQFFCLIASLLILSLPAIGWSNDAATYGLTNNAAYSSNFHSQNINQNKSWTSIIAPKTSNDAAVVGNLVGNFHVDQNGSANYDIALSSTPGAAGMTPKLSLHYDSSQDDGILGMGFSLSGLTAITRVSQNYTQNGQIHGVDFTNNDRFQLNGQQLVAVNGANYGADGTEYRTYIDSQARIISKGTQGNGPASFVVQSKGGQTAYYGSTTDSTILAQGTQTVNVWPLSKIMDASGNYIEYHYQQDNANGAYYPSEIDYTGNDTTKLAVNNSIKFIYEPRPDPITSYQAGSIFKITQRLKEIQIYHANNLVYDYKLNYEVSPNTAKSRITSIQECDGSGECLKPLNFTWQTNQEGWVEADQYATSTPIVCDVGQGWQDCGVRFADLQGTGQLWMLQANDHARGSWKLVNGQWQQDNSYLLPGSYGFVNIGNISGSQFMGDLGARLVDLTGNGLLDLVQSDWWNNQESFIGTLINTGNGWQESPQWALPVGWSITNNQGKDAGGRFVDLSGTGRPDYIHSAMWNQQQQQQYKDVILNNGSGWTSSSRFTPPAFMTNDQGKDNGVRILDLVGDGLPDIVQNTFWDDTGESSGRWTNPLRTGANQWDSSSNLVPPTQLTNYHLKSINAYNRDTGARFVNVLLGDNKPALLVGNTWLLQQPIHQAWIDTGTQWVEADEYAPPTDLTTKFGIDNGVVYEDLTGSGLPMMLQNTGVGGGISHAWKNIPGKGWVEDDNYLLPVQITEGTGHDNGVRFVDLLGTGFPDIIISTTSQHQAFLNKAQIKPDIITNIQDALGDNLQIQYRPITDNNIYTKGHNAQYPNMDLQIPIWVVSQTNSDTAVTPIPAINRIQNKLTKLLNVNSQNNTQHITTYHYANALYNHLGLGFLGFGQMTATDQYTGISVTSAYSQDISQHTEGMPLTSQTTLANGTIINQQTNVLQTKTYGSGQVNQTYYLPYVSQSSETAYDLNGTKLNTKTTATTIDDYANPTDIVQVATDGTGTYTTETQNSYQNHVDNNQWNIGELTDAKVTASAPNTPTITRNSSYTYDQNTGLLVSATSFYPLSTSKTNAKTDADFLTRHYQRDGFGNIIETDMTGSNISPRSEKVQYDAEGRFIISKTNALNQTMQYQIDPNFGVMIQSKDPNGLILTNQLDGFGRITNTTHPDRTQTKIAYQWAQEDSNAPAGSVYEIIQTQTDSPEKISYYDELDREIAQAIQGWNGQWVWQLTNYDELGRVIGKSTPFYAQDIKNIDVTTNQYDVLGRIILTTNPDDTTIQQIYNGYSTTIINPKQQKTTRTMNVRGDLIQSTDAEGHITHYQYDAFDHLVKMIDSQNNITTMTYDNLGNKISIQDPDRGHWNYQYDALGELTQQVDPLNQITQFQYDLLGRMVARTDLAGTPDSVTSTWQYDTAPNGIGKIAQENGVSNLNNTAPTSYQIAAAAKDNQVNYNKIYNYDNLGRLIQTIINLNGQNYTTSTTYDSDSRPSIITYANKVSIKNNYDAYSHLISISDPNSGKLYQQINSVDAVGHVLSKTLSNGLMTTYTYDPKTNFLIAIETAPSSYLQVQQQLFPQYTHRSSHGWHIQSVSNTSLQPLTINTPQQDGTLLSSISQSSVQVPQSLPQDSNKPSFQGIQSSSQSSQPSSHDLIAGSNDSSTFSSSSKNQNEATPIQSLQYTYDSLGNVMARNDHVLNIQDEYQYDDLNRLTQDQIYSPTQSNSSTQPSLVENNSHENSSAITLNYAYNELGNITNKSDVGNYHYGNRAGPHAVTSIDGGNETDTFQYDVVGNQTQATEQTQNGTINRIINYTSFDVPKSISQTNNQTNVSGAVNFYYNANHQRFMRQDTETVPSSIKNSSNASTITTTTLYLDGLEVDAINDGTTTHTIYKNYIGDTELVTDDQGNTHRYDILKDNIGSTSIITDEQGNVVQRFHYDPFGEQQLIQDVSSRDWQRRPEYRGIQQVSSRDQQGTSQDNRSAITRYGFTGQEEVQSGDIDLIHMNGRMYDPHLGRFLSADPDIQDPSNSQSLNRYSYCLNNPLAYTDPTGFSWWSNLWKSAKHLFHNVGHAIDSALSNRVFGTLLVVTASAIAIWATGGFAAFGMVHAVNALGTAEWFTGAASVSGMVTYAQTGSINAGLLSAAESFAEMYAWKETGDLDGHLFKGQGSWFGDSWMHGMTGGSVAVLEGGSFKDGFIASAVTEAMSGPIANIGSLSDDSETTIATIAARGAAAGIVGGTASAAVGSSFENGAMTSAYGEMFNSSLHGLEYYSNQYSNQQALTTAMGPNAVVFGIRPLDGANNMSDLYGANKIHYGWYHENMFWTDESGILHNYGFFEKGGIRSDYLFPENIREYHFSPINYNHPINVLGLHPNGYTQETYHLFEFWHHLDCQDYADTQRKLQNLP